MKNLLKESSIIVILASLVSFGMGFYKMFAYNSGEYEDAVNSYVGGDAYNYIINGTYTTAYFVLGGSLLIAGFLMLVIHQLQINRLDTLAAEAPVDNSAFISALNEASEKSE